MFADFTSRTTLLTFLLVFAAALAGCGDDDDGTNSNTYLRWRATCPSTPCDAAVPNVDDMKSCTNNYEGDVCTTEGVSCGPAGICNVYLICASSDPCPPSQ